MRVFRGVFVDERGTLATTMAMLVLPIALLMGMIALDIGRIHSIRGQMQTAVDAAALAGALTARVVPQYRYVPITDGKGNIIGIRQELAGLQAVIDPPTAEAAARLTFLQNARLLEGTEGRQRMVELNVQQAATTDDFTGWVIDNSKYLVRVVAKLKTFAAEPLFYLYGQEKALKPLGSTGMAEAVVVPQ
ncbi:MAG: pilus assembly protein TadG-related protein [Moorellaceae bacterium]